VRISIASQTSEVEINLGRDGSVTVYNHEPEPEAKSLENKLGSLVDLATGLVNAAATPEPVQPPPHRRRKR
jgi:hypothetical protein